MIYLIDGSNVLGRMRLDRESADAKRELARRIAVHLKGGNHRAVLFFDGGPPPQFRPGTGSVAVRFGNGRPADDLILLEAEKLPRCTVVTSDRSLAARVRGRRVELIESAAFAASLSEVERAESGQMNEDWEAFFLDEKNRNI